MSYPHHRVNDILRRMEDNKLQPDTMKTCFGILAIMSREEPNKQIIAREGMEMILAIMISHLDKIDVQESGCDLLWSLAFNNIAIKDIIADNCGASVVVSALKRHSKSGDFLKSACGALSNMCQSKMNQEAVACQGGLRPLVDAISIHQSNGKLLLFVFDALASVIVGNEENARMVSSLGFIPLVIASIGQHKSAMDVVKSACHTLAILSDVKGQASSIAFAGGVPVILSLLDLHANYADLHRVAAVVLLRMLQESVHVGREIAAQEGVRILLKSLEKGGAQHDTVAAVTHILFTITNPSTSLTSIESQLWLPDPKSSHSDSNIDASGKVIGSRFSNNIANIRCGNSSADNLRSTGRNLLLGHGSNILNNAANKIVRNNSDINAVMDAHPHSSSSSLSGLVHVIGQYAERRDVVRASCRLLVNISHYSGVTSALEKLGILEKLLDCVFLHKEARDVVESTALLLKEIKKTTKSFYIFLGIHRRNPPSDISNKASIIGGLLIVFQNKIKDEEVAKSCSELLVKIIDNHATPRSTDPRTLFTSSTPHTRGSNSGLLTNAVNNPANVPGAKPVLTIADYRNADGKIWEYEAITLAIKALDHLCAGAAGGSARKSCSPGKKDLDVKCPKDKEKEKEKEERDEKKEEKDENCVSNPTSMKVTPITLIKGVSSWSKHTPKSISSLLSLIECLTALPKMHTEHALLDQTKVALQSLLTVLPVRNSDLARRVERILSKLHSALSSARWNDDNPNPTASTPSTPLFPVLSSRSGSSSRPSSTKDISNLKESCVSSLNAKDGSTTVLRNSAAGKVQAILAHPTSRYYRVDETSHSKKLYPLHPSKSTVSTGNPNDPNGLMTPRLLEIWPNFLEKLCTSCGSSREFVMSPSTADRMHMVYESTSAAGRGVMSKCHTPVPYEVPAEGCGQPFGHSLTFDSEFECGNLLRAVQRGDASYDLFLRSDLHTEGNTQWFYFAVSNTHPSGMVKLSEQGVQVAPARVRFNIVNLTKPDSLFNSGMRPVVYSCVDAGTRGIGWLRSGSDISYYSNSHLRNNNCGEGNSQYYTLSFTVEFQHPKDTVLLAYSYPYSVADYKSHIKDILHRPSAFDIIRSSRLCTTLGGENCDLLVITNFKDKLDKERIGPVTVSAMEAEANSWNSSTTKKAASGSMRGNPLNIKLKPALFFSGRVHPGETPASWMMKGILEFLTGDSPQAMLLRQIFVIYIVPLLNPDGVIFGNNRCSLSGVDLNRQWKTPLKVSHPTIYTLKSFIYMMKKIRDVNMYIDLHGHSRKYNVFMYGCDEKKKAKPLVRAFPKYFSSHPVGGKYVNYSDCSFHVRKGRESTARVVVSRELNIPLSFTLEATFCGSNYGPYQNCHMNIGHMQEVGASLCDAVLQFSLAENLIKDVQIVPQNVKTRKERADSAKNDSDGLNTRETPKDLIRTGSMKDLMKDLKDTRDNSKDSRNFHNSSSRGDRKDRKVVLFSSTGGTSSTGHSDNTAVSSLTNDDDKTAADEAMTRIDRRKGRREGIGEDQPPDTVPEKEEEEREDQDDLHVYVEGEGDLEGIDEGGGDGEGEGEGDNVDAGDDADGDCGSGSEAEGEEHGVDDSDSDFTVNDVESQPVRTHDDPAPFLALNTASASSDGEILPDTTSHSAAWNCDEDLKHGSELKSGDKILEDSAFHGFKNKKEKNKIDLPPLGKAFITVTSQLANSLNNSGPNPVALVPLIVSGGAVSTPHSNSSSPIGGDFGSYLASTSSPPSNPGPGALGKEGFLGDEWGKKSSPAPPYADESSSCRGFRDETVVTSKTYGSSTHTDDSRHNSSKYHHILLSEKKERDKDRFQKDLKDFIVIDGLERSRSLGHPITQTRRGTASIVTGHSLLQTNASIKDPPLHTDNTFDTLNITNSTPRVAHFNSSNDEKPLVNAILSSSNTPQIGLCGTNIFKVDPFTPVSPHNGDRSSILLGGSLKNQIKAIRNVRNSFSEISISSMASSLDLTTDTSKLSGSKKPSFLTVAVKKKKKRK